MAEEHRHLNDSIRRFLDKGDGNDVEGQGVDEWDGEDVDGREAMVEEQNVMVMLKKIAVDMLGL